MKGDNNFEEILFQVFRYVILHSTALEITPKPDLSA